jgi:hypothetical protein
MPTTQEYLKAIEGAYYRTVGLIEKDLQATTRTWDHKPEFTVTTERKGGEFSVTAGTDNRIYGWVDAGTKAHVILPKRSKYLSFSSGYKAKTRVGVIGSNEGGAFGSSVFAAAVHHPGFPGRKFIINISKRRQVTLRQQTEQAVAAVNRLQK